LQVRGIPGQQIRIRKTGAVIGRGVAGDLHGRFHGGANGRRVRSVVEEEPLQPSR
jgi:hypothetical protein